MSTTTQGNFGSSRGIANAKDEPDHLLVLVHGIMARYVLIKEFVQTSMHQDQTIRKKNLEGTESKKGCV